MSSSGKFEHTLYLYLFSSRLSTLAMRRDFDLKLGNPEHAKILKAVVDANPELKPSIILREALVLDDGIFRL